MGLALSVMSTKLPNMEAMIQFTNRGLYVPAADIYIDPWRPVDRAVITHAHADHARPGHGAYLATPDTCVMLRHRLGKVRLDPLEFATHRQIGGAKISLHPAGHLPGSAQVRVEVAGEVWVISGDYKTEDDGLSEAFEPVTCHSFVTECTFGLPVFNWLPQAQIGEQIDNWWRQNASLGLTSIIGAYSLGKAQRLMHCVNPDIGPILTHSAVEGTNRVLREAGVTLPKTQSVSELDKIPKGALVIAPPSAVDAAWAKKKLGPISTGFASGWMQLRGVRRRRGVGRGFVMSDHADWNGLLDAIKSTNAENIYCTHGYTDIFNKYLNENGWYSQIVPTEFGNEEAGE